MRLDELRPAAGARRRAKRVGRGNAGRGGTYAGRGRKGQGAREGGGKGAYFEGGQLPFVRRLPRLRGFTNIFRVQYTPIGLDDLQQHFRAGQRVTPDRLVDAGLLRRSSEPYKILASGELTKRLTVQAPRISATARQAIEAQGGSWSPLPDDYRRAGMGRSLQRRHSRRR
jgi:large subunit ribosomal protein L15